MGKLKPRDSKGHAQSYMAEPSSLSVGVCPLRCEILKCEFWSGSFQTIGDICDSLLVSWAEDGNIGYEVEIPKLSISLNGTDEEKA